MKNTWKIIAAFVVGVIITVFVMWGVNGSLFAGQLTPLTGDKVIIQTLVTKTENIEQKIDALAGAFKTYTSALFPVFEQNTYDWMTCVNPGCAQNTLTIAP
jgi:hypothetical protein